MARSSVRWEGMEELAKTLQGLTKCLTPDQVEPVLLEGAMMFADKIEQNAPIGPTGRLKKSIIAKMLKRLIWRKPAAAIAAVNRSKVSGAPHAHLVEWGTSHSGAHPFFRPAVNEVMESAAKHVIKRLEDLIDKAWG